MLFGSFSKRLKNKAKLKVDIVTLQKPSCFLSRFKKIFSTKKNDKYFTKNFLLISKAEEKDKELSELISKVLTRNLVLTFIEAAKEGNR